MFYSLLRMLPGGDSAKIFTGVVVICGLSYLPMLTKKGKAYDSIADKRAAQEAEQPNPELAAAAAARS